MDIKAIIVCLLLGVVQAPDVVIFSETLEGLQGELQSPGYPDNYNNGIHKTWQLNLPWTDKTYTLTLNIEMMDIEGTPPNCHDFIKVDHKEYCGKSPKEIKVYGVTSGLIIEFTSDGSVFGKGFKGKYQFDEE